ASLSAKGIACVGVLERLRQSRAKTPPHWRPAGHLSISRPARWSTRTVNGVRGSQRLDELPKLDGFFRPSTMFEISIALALRCTTASAVHAADATASYCGRATELLSPL